jgi:hypothetical protein
MKTRSFSPLRRAIPGLFAVLATIAAGAAAIAPAGSAQAAIPAKFTWHTLTLLNSWKTASTAKLDEGTPAWAVQNGVVYLRGAIAQPNSAGSDTFGQLPNSAAPAHVLYLDDNSAHDVPGTLYVDPSGALKAYNGRAYTFTSLSGISFPTKSITPKPLALEGGWKSGQNSYSTGNPGYAVSKGVVYLSGSLLDGTQADMFTLPKPARPARELYIMVYTFDGNPGWILIEPTGVVEVSGSDSSGFTSLAGISYPVASAKWHKFTLGNHWISGYSNYKTASPEYAAINGIVYLNGSVAQTTIDKGIWASLPVAARPADAVQVEVLVANGYAGAVTLVKSQGHAYSYPFENAEQFTSLAGISYPASS